MPIYLDNSATTAVRPEVAEAMMHHITHSWGNPSSAHALGRQAKQAVDKAREQMATFMGCLPEEVYFSPCGTVSNNVALLGRARFAEANGQGRHLITTQIEHPAIIGPAQYLESHGWKVTYLPVDRDGIIRMDELRDATTSDTSMISVMWANNEIGSLQPIEKIADFAADRKIYFHTDAVQVPGKLRIDMSALPVNSLALSGHKFHAPKGIGALYVRKLTNLMPISFGGGQEMGLMPGTEGVASIVALGAAAELAHLSLENTRNHLRMLQELLMERLLAVPGVRVTGPSDPEKRLPGHVSLVVPGAQGEALVLRADISGICVSSGSACHKGIIEPSQVLKACGLSNETALGSVRITAGALNTREEVLAAAETLAKILTKATKEVHKGASAQSIV